MNLEKILIAWRKADIRNLAFKTGAVEGSLTDKAKAEDEFKRALGRLRSAGDILLQRPPEPSEN